MCPEGRLITSVIATRDPSWVPNEEREGERLVPGGHPYCWSARRREP